MKRRAVLMSSNAGIQKTPKRKKIATTQTIPRGSLSRALARETDPREYKVTDSQIGPVSISSAGTTLGNNLLTNLVRGTDAFNNFIGVKIKPAGLDFRYNLNCGDVNQIVRVILVQSMLPGQVVLSQVLQLQTDPRSPVLLGNRQDLIILYDKLIPMSLASSTGGDTYAERVYIKGNKMAPVQYPNGTITFPSMGGLWVFYQSDSAIAPNPTIQFYSRITFTDD